MAGRLSDIHNVPEMVTDNETLRYKKGSFFLFLF